MNRKSIFWGIIIILLGLILLVNNFQILPWRVWVELLRFWPIILIAIGVDLIFRKSSLSFLQILSPLLIIAAIGGAIYLSQTGQVYKEKSEVFKFHQSLSPDLEQANVEINFGAGILKLRGGSIYLFDGDFITPSWLRPKMRYKATDREGFLELSEEGKRDRFEFGRWGEEHSWILRLNNKTPLTLKIKTGASSNYLDLSSLKVTYLELKTGVSKNEIRFGSLTSTRAKISAGASQITIFIPRSIGAKIEADTALTSTNLNELGFRKQGDVYFSNNYSTAENRLELEVEVGVSSIRVEFF